MEKEDEPEKEEKETGSNSKKAALFEELSADHVNVLRVRALCRAHPGTVHCRQLQLKQVTSYNISIEYHQVHRSVIHIFLIIVLYCIALYYIHGHLLAPLHTSTPRCLLCWVILCRTDCRLWCSYANMVLAASGLAVICAVHFFFLLPLFLLNINISNSNLSCCCCELKRK